MKNVNNCITRRRGERGELVPSLSASAPLRETSLVLMKSLKFYGVHYSLFTNHLCSSSEVGGFIYLETYDNISSFLTTNTFANSAHGLFQFLYSKKVTGGKVNQSPRYHHYNQVP